MISGDNTKRYKKSIKVHNSKGNNKIEQNRANNEEWMHESIKAKAYITTINNGQVNY